MLASGRASSHQNVLPIPMDRQHPDGDWIILQMEVSLKVGCLPSAFGKQPSDPCLPARMLDKLTSNTCVLWCRGTDIKWRWWWCAVIYPCPQISHSMIYAWMLKGWTPMSPQKSFHEPLFLFCDHVDNLFHWIDRLSGWSDIYNSRTT